MNCASVIIIASFYGSWGASERKMFVCRNPKSVSVFGTVWVGIDRRRKMPRICFFPSGGFGWVGFDHLLGFGSIRPLLEMSRFCFFPSGAVALAGLFGTGDVL